MNLDKSGNRLDRSGNNKDTPALNLDKRGQYDDRAGEEIDRSGLLVDSHHRKQAGPALPAHEKKTAGRTSALWSAPPPGGREGGSPSG